MTLKPGTYLINGYAFFDRIVTAKETTKVWVYAFGYNADVSVSAVRIG
ncbi:MULTISPECIES: hypothetical protein [Mumia]|nr:MULTISPECIES: hypothetical protein [unclassified Mumia]QMW66630.1 hypothetical protein H4N58_01195 [Mumia sp. ZJ1417]